jgi:hypothetical protein
MTGGKQRPIQITEKQATGYAIQEEVFSIIDKLFKSYIKPEP